MAGVRHPVRYVTFDKCFPIPRFLCQVFDIFVVFVSNELEIHFENLKTVENDRKRKRMKNVSDWLVTLKS
ncbi:hypothetical protein Phum_PHUM540560 [Pediculus humanus corporis]|uniref:Uncharacterized protein n=1 Tax=Pediculus humanus subsp. corporis TaxID=121224 RepID=E0VZY4_PEDHC|nr:uncharacterized protein Phum_PHUM540560 [Pediculus humanus corporis]EEB18943.1 hypothetical protein Phum_PHUM540560 [Pediculus humanus corporis]